MHHQLPVLGKEEVFLCESEGDTCVPLELILRRFEVGFDIMAGSEDTYHAPMEGVFYGPLPFLLPELTFNRNNSTKSTPGLRPDFLAQFRGKAIFRGEEKAGESLEAARNELRTKLRKEWMFGDVKYIYGYHQYRECFIIDAIFMDDVAGQFTVAPLTRKFNLHQRANLMDAFKATCNVARLIATSLPFIPEDGREFLPEDKERSRGVVLKFRSDAVVKVYPAKEAARVKFIMQTLQLEEVAG
jgi:hypothetical protein